MSGEGNSSTDANGDGNTDPPAPQGTSATTFTQDQVQAIATREADKAKRAATKAMLEELGFTSKEEAAKFVNGAKEAEKAQMTEAERIKAEAEAEKAAAAAERATFANERHTATLERALVMAGVPLDPDKPEKLARVARLVDVEVGADAAAIKAAVEAVKVEFPQMFGAPGSAPSPSSEPATGGAPPTRTNGMTALERGAAAAKQRLGRTS